jgi:AcrR family transcriptional regulator
MIYLMTTAEQQLPTEPCPPRTGRPLRADALRNRAKILDTARVVFAERGLEVTLDDIAHHAGLGVGTVYRRFADREALVEALFDDRMREQIHRLRDALADPDPWHGLVTFMAGTCALIAADRGMRQVMLSSTYGHGEIAQCRDQFGTLGKQLVDRAKATGELRPSFEVTDVLVFFLLIGTVADFAGDTAPTLWRRYFEIMVDGMRARPGQDPDLPPPLTEEQAVAASRHCPIARR